MLLIGSVLKQDEMYWNAIQYEFLKQTTSDFRLIVASVDKPEFYDIWLQKRDDSHPAGLQLINDYFLNNPKNTYLYLDSDAFPIRSGWQSKLNCILSRFNKKYAAPIRYENLEGYPHVSFVYVPGDIELIASKIALHGGLDNNFAKYFGIDKRDLGSHLPLDALFPLFRSNQVSLHPALHSIYYNMVYHHSCGSRSNYMVSYPYWTCCNIDMKDRNEEFFEDPAAFISKLAGPNQLVDQLINLDYPFWPKKVIKLL